MSMRQLLSRRFWSLTANIGGYVLGSLFSQQDMIERIQATVFVDAFRRRPVEAQVWQRSAAGSCSIA